MDIDWSLDSADTFADDSKSGNREEDLVVTAQVPAGADFPWLSDLPRKVARGREVKYRDFNRLLRHSPESDLCRAVLRGISRATIFITDPEVYRGPFRRDVVEPLWGPLDRYHPVVRERIMEPAEDYVRSMVLLDSPLVQAADRLGVASLEQVQQVLVPRRGKEPNAYLFGARSTATVLDLMDKQVLEEECERFRDRFYFDGRQVYASIVRRALAERHAFDEGDTLVTDEINSLRAGLHRAVTRDLWFQDPAEEDESPIVCEAKSATTPMLQVADIAAGYARHLYATGGDERLKRVQDHFCAVVFNGDLLQRLAPA
jgi:hypothetical protein